MRVVEQMMVGKTEISCTTGELIPNLPNSGVRPIVDVERGGYSHSIYQDQLGRLVQTDNKGHLLPRLFDVKLTKEERRVIRQMFSRFNSQHAGQTLGKKSLGKLWRRFPGDTVSVGLVACSAKKRDIPSKAKDMYLGELFKKGRAWAEAFCDEWGILSAKYGLVLPDEVIAPYDQRVGEVMWTDKPRKQLAGESEKDYKAMLANFYKNVQPKMLERANDSSIRMWASRVSYQCYMQWGEDTHFYLLAGKDYRSPFARFNIRGFASTAPMTGLSIGEQLSWLKNQTQGLPTRQESGKPKKRKLRLGAPKKAKQ